MINTSSAFWQAKVIGGVINNFTAIFPLCAFAHNGEKRIQDMVLGEKSFSSNEKWLEIELPAMAETVDKP